MQNFTVIESLSELDDTDCDNVYGILKLYDMTYNDARRLISREQYREGTVEFHKAMKAKMMICKAEIKEMYSARDATEELQTPPLTRR
jgi:hypothetical protein